MAKRRYSEDSIARALKHHEATGAVRAFVAPMKRGDPWRVEVIGWEPVELSTPQAYALTLGLAAGERNYKPLSLGDFGD